MLQPPVIYDNGMQRRMSPGDLLAGFEPVPPATDTTNTTLAVTAAMFLNSSVYVRNPAGVSTDTYPTADALITALIAGQFAPTKGMTFRWRVINLSANLITGAVTANTGVTMVRGNILASTSKDFLISLTNVSTLRSVSNIVSVNGSAVLSGFSQADCAALDVGMIVTTATAGLQGQTIIGINQTAGTVTMSGNANANATNSYTFSPTYTITGLSA